MMKRKVIPAEKISSLHTFDFNIIPSSGGKDKHSQQDEKNLLEEKINEAYQRGKQDGIREGLCAVSQQIETFKAMIGQLKQYQEKLYEDAKLELVELAFKIAEKILGREVSLKRDVVLSIIEKAIKEVRDKSHITIYVSPIDEPTVLEYKDKLLEGIEGEVKILPDPSVSAGGCIIQTSFGRIDALIETQLKEIRKKITGTD